MTASAPSPAIDAVTVVVPTHNPRPDLLRSLISALAVQHLPSDRWELVLVDNASTAPLTPDLSPLTALGVPCRVVREPRPGLTYARLAGFAAATHATIALLDDDNLPRPDFLAQAVRFTAEHPAVGVFGGRSLPRFAIPPPPWFSSTGLRLGCRDLGNAPLFASAHPRPESYPACAPIGAGMVLHRDVAAVYAAHVAAHPDALTDRQGNNLSSGGDCEIVLVALLTGHDIAYAPTLVLDHLIPASRLEPNYLARLNRASSRSWVALLDRFGLNPWPAVSPLTVPLRQLRAWWTQRAWRGPPETIAWAGACGILEGRGDLKRRSSTSLASTQ